MLVYVDDLIMAGPCSAVLQSTAAQLVTKVSIRVEKEVSKFIEIVITRNYEYRRIKISNPTIIEQLVSKFGLVEAKTCSVPIHLSANLHSTTDRDEGEFETVPHVPYNEIVGSLLHLCNTVRPDIAFACSLLYRYMQEPRRCHWNSGKSVLRYPKKTKDMGIVYGSSTTIMAATLHGYFDADYAGDRAERKSTSGFVFKYNNAAISWRSKKQTIVAQSSCESEYVGISFAVREALKLDRLFKDDFGISSIASNKGMVLFVDNQGAMKIAENDSITERSKHIEVKYHFIKHHIKAKKVHLEYVPTDEQIADVMTKLLAVQKHSKFTAGMGMGVHDV